MSLKKSHYRHIFTPQRRQVLGEVGGSLNYDELVVYDNKAIKPSYLVMYES